MKFSKLIFQMFEHFVLDRQIGLFELGTSSESGSGASWGCFAIIELGIQRTFLALGSSSRARELNWVYVPVCGVER
jgi:hypothetical protein